MLVYKTQKDAFGAVDVPDVRQDGWCHTKLTFHVRQLPSQLRGKRLRVCMQVCNPTWLVTWLCGEHVDRGKYEHAS